MPLPNSGAAIHPSVFSITTSDAFTRWIYDMPVSNFHRWGHVTSPHNTLFQLQSCIIVSVLLLVSMHHCVGVIVWCSDLKHLKPVNCRAQLKLLGDFHPVKPCIIHDPYGVCTIITMCCIFKS